MVVHANMIRVLREKDFPKVRTWRLERD